MKIARYARQTVINEFVLDINESYAAALTKRIRSYGNPNLADLIPKDIEDFWLRRISPRSEEQVNTYWNYVNKTNRLESEVRGWIDDDIWEYSTGEQYTDRFCTNSWEGEVIED